MTEFVTILVTAASEAEAEVIADQLLSAKLIACANIVGGVRSVFSWAGAVQRESEVLIIMKSRQALFQEIEQKVRQLHSYDVPEILAIPILTGSEPYLQWLGDETAR